jgi:hypothetical protein
VITLEHSSKSLRSFAIFAVIVLLAATLQPAIASPLDNRRSSFPTPEPSYISPTTASALTALAQMRAVANQQRDSGLDVGALQNATPAVNRTDMDGDGLFDSVEWVLGTDFNNTDSDFDQLNDSFEVYNDLDPLKPDSNDDGLADYFEVTNVTSLDLDSDGYPNARDFDNDGDGVPDALDLSPFSKSTSHASFQFDVKTNGNPTYINFQLRPKNPDHLRQTSQTWDWPPDREGSMMDLNNSKDDVHIIPMLELIVPVEGKLIANHSDKCLEVFNASLDDGANVQQANCSNGTNQLWKLEHVDDGYYRIRANHSGKCLEVFNASLDDGANVQQANYSNGTNQLWKLETVGNGTYKLIAKHSGKCLEVAANSTADGANVQQNEYWGRDNQLWKLELVENVLPNQSEVDDYSLSVTLNKVSIPLSKSKDLGAPVALSGKMFFPASNPLNISADAQLVWMVTGNSDKTGEKIAMRAPTGKYVSAESGGGKELVANRDSIGDWETFEIVFVAENKVALKVHNGQYIGVDHERVSFGWGMDWEWYPLIANRAAIGLSETFILERLNGQVALKAYNGQYVCVGCASGGLIFLPPEGLYADSTSPVFFDQIQVAEAETETTILARYKEDFMLTGFSVDENYGSDVGVFYSSDINQTLTGGFVMTHAFTRNSTTHLSEMPAILAEYNVTQITSKIESFSHQDEALLAITTNMTPNAVSELPEDRTLPTITAFENDFTSIAMDELVSDSHILGTTFAINLTNLPVVTMKGFKMGWYNTTADKNVGIDGIVTEMQEWIEARGLDNDTSATMMSLVLSWHAGESRVTSIGSDYSAFNEYENEFVLNQVELNGVGNIINTVQATRNSEGYKIIKGFRYAAKGIRVTISVVKGVLKLLRVINTVKQGAVGASAKASIVFIFIDALITQALALYAFFTIAMDQGWSSFGIYVATITYFFELYYYVAVSYLLPSIGFLLLGPIGVILAIAYLILDLIFGFGSDLLEAIIGWFTDINVYNDVDLDMKENSMNIADYDDNGLDVGDRIEIKNRMIGLVQGGKYLSQSYIDPSIVYSVEPNSVSNHSTIYSATDWVYGSNQKVREYETGLWVDPKSMINFPLTFWLVTNYRVSYEECWWLFGWHCDDDDKTSTSKTAPTTIYFDVVPGTITDFVYWRQISSLDHDGDGLLNSEEQANGTNQWRFDTDSDGLSDTIEINYGTNPIKSDTDADGLNDYLELRLGTDPFERDTDEDGLSDSEEHNGWQVDFTYYGHEFTETVWSDPLMPDTDDDGLSDLEEFMKRLNPRSGDTDGNGTHDANESITPIYGCIKDVDLNGMGSSIKVIPGDLVTATVEYRLIGVRDPDSGAPANCSILITMDNSSLNETIYNGTPNVGNITVGSATFSFNASSTEGIYKLRHFWNWSCLNETLPEEEREVIGIVIATENASAEWVTDGADDDGDGIIDINEAIGWDVNFTDANGSHTIHVTSDFSQKDTDSDGLTDLEEWNWFTNSSNPRAADTDGDGVTDLVELLWDYDVLSYDTDGDGLDDGAELTFNSDPKVKDTDDDGLNDKEEFAFNSDPNTPDTDGDGLSDWNESECGSSLLQPDPDDDTLFDTLECSLGTDPWNPDTDDDGLQDGYEVYVTNTSALLNDTDFDLLLDGDELTWKTDPLYNDTDLDGLWDGIELELGTNPLYKDTDYDSINDSEDPDSYAAHVDPIILAHDPDEDIDEFMTNLERYTNVTTVLAEELLANYTDASYIVLVGRPDAGNGTVGNITKTILADSNETLTQMLESDYDRFALKYGVWNSTQTVVMLSRPYPGDHWRVLSLLKTQRETVLPGSVEVEWPTPRDLFRVDSENTLKETDSLIWVALDEAVIPRVKLSRYTSSTTPRALTRDSGLARYDKPIGRYLAINVSENVQNETGDIITMALVRIYYTAADLDRTGDGLANDTRDIDESTLRLYVFNEYTGKWTKLTNATSWVFDTGVNTTNVELYGKSYEGYVWANVSHFSLFGIASEGQAHGGGATPDSDNDGLSDLEEILKGTDPNNPDTDGDGIIDSLDRYPLDPTLPVQPAVTPSPSLPPSATPLITPLITPATTPVQTPEASPTPEEPGFEAILWLLAVAFSVIIGYLGDFKRKRL